MTPDEIFSAAEQVAWLRPETLKPASGVSPYVCTGWGNMFASGVGDFGVGTGAPKVIDPSTIHRKGGRRVELVDAGVGSPYFEGPDLPNLYKGAHDGSGFTVSAALLTNDSDATQIPWATCNVGLAQSGGFLRLDGVNQRITFQVNNASGAFLFQVVTAIGTAPRGALLVVTTEFGLSAPGVYDWTIRMNGELIRAGELGASKVPSAADSQGPLSIGRRSESASEYFDGMLFEFVAGGGMHGAETDEYMIDRNL